MSSNLNYDWFTLAVIVFATVATLREMWLRRHDINRLLWAVVAMATVLFYAGSNILNVLLTTGPRGSQYYSPYAAILLVWIAIVAFSPSVKDAERIRRAEQATKFKAMAQKINPQWAALVNKLGPDEIQDLMGYIAKERDARQSLTKDDSAAS